MAPFFLAREIIVGHFQVMPTAEVTSGDGKPALRCHQPPLLLIEHGSANSKLAPTVQIDTALP